MRHDTTFHSDGCKLAAHLYLPEPTGTPVPGIVLCHGFAGVKELLLPPFADYFCSSGFAVLAFDYRGFGAIEGEAGRIIPEYQVRDIGNAISFMQSREEVDTSRIGLWGSSLGGANAIAAAARDDRVKCLCVQLTFGSGHRMVTGNQTPEEQTKFNETILRMLRKRAATGKELMVPLHKVLSDEQSKRFFEEQVSTFSALTIKVPFLTIAETMLCNPEALLPDLHIPLHITAAGNDLVNPPEESRHLFAAANEPKELLMVDGAGHYEVYQGEAFKEVARQQAEWFGRYL